MSARASTWRRQLPLIVAACLFAAGNLVIFLAYRSSTQMRRQTLVARRDDLQRAVKVREAEAARLSGQRDRLSGVSSAIEEFYGRRIGSERETLAPVVAEVHAILKEAGVSAPQISYATTSVQKLPLAQMRIAFSVRCDYARFKKLLRSFEMSRRWIVVRSVSIGRDAGQPGSVQVELELVTYFSERAGALERPAKADKTARGAASTINVAAVTARTAG